MSRHSMSAAVLTGWVAVLLGGAIFGFFYAWVCSTMWGLDAADPRVAIPAMQAMNASVRNPVFFPAFFLTPLVMATGAVLARRERRPVMAALLAAAGCVYLVGGLLLTVLVNVPMNEALAAVDVPEARAEAERVWSEYSTRWQLVNQLRTLAGGVSLLLAAAALSMSRVAPGPAAHSDLAGDVRPDAEPAAGFAARRG